MDENQEFHGKQKRLNKTELLDFKSKHSKMIREQPCIFPAYEPPQLKFEDLFPPEDKPPPPRSNKNLIMQVLRDAGVDVSRTVTINKKTYEDTFTNEPLAVKMLKEHTKNDLVKDNDHKMDNQDTKIYRHSSGKVIIERKSSGKPKKASSDWTEVERKEWNNEQKRIQLINSKEEYQNLYSEESDKKSHAKHAQSVDFFENDNEDFPSLDALINENSQDDDQDSEDTKPEPEIERLMDTDDVPPSTQDLPLLCSGRFDTQLSTVNYQPKLTERQDKPLHSHNNPLKFLSDTPKLSHKKKLNINDFIEDEAEQSGSEVSLGSDYSDSDSDLGSIPEFIDNDHKASSVEDEKQHVLRAHLDDILLEDDLKIEAIKELHFPGGQDLLLNVKEEACSDTESFAPDISFKNYITEPPAESSEEEHGDDDGINKMRSYLTRDTTVSKPPVIASVPVVEDEDAILPEYSSEQQTLLTMIKLNKSGGKLIGDDDNGSDSKPSFIRTLQSKNITSLDCLNPSVQNSNSACVFTYNDSRSTRQGFSHKSESNDASKFGSFNVNSSNSQIPVGSIFSFLNQKNTK